MNFRFGDDDIARLEALAAHYELKEAQVIRMLLKKEWEAIERKKP